MFPKAVKNDSKGEPTESLIKQGSLRRVIPPLEVDKEFIFGRHNEDLNKLFKTYKQEYILLAEYKMIQSEDIQGVYVIPSRENPLVWFGVVFARTGPYQDGVFRFSIVLDEHFPDCGHPQVTFQTKVYHPVINAGTNQLNLLGAFPKWHKSEQHIWQVLKYIQWIFAHVEASAVHSVNQEASEMLRNDKDSFLSNARKLAQLSRDQLYDSPPTEDAHYIVFEQFNPELHKKEKMIRFLHERKESKKTGYSWVLPNSFKALERPATPPTENGIGENV